MTDESLLNERPYRWSRQRSNTMLWDGAHPRTGQRRNHTDCEVTLDPTVTAYITRGYSARGYSACQDRVDKSYDPSLRWMRLDRIRRRINPPLITAAESSTAESDGPITFSWIGTRPPDCPEPTYAAYVYPLELPDHCALSPIPCYLPCYPTKCLSS